MHSTSKIAVLTSHGQPSDPMPAEASLAEMAHQVAQILPDWEIRSATLATPGRLEQTVENGVLVYPFFMSDGWFTSQVLPRRLAGFQHHLLPPFGKDPALPATTAQIIRQAFAGQAFSTRAKTGTKVKPSLLLAAHGSARGPKAAAATERFAAALRIQLGAFEVITSYIEQPPYLADVATRLSETDLCLPFFAQSGDHVTKDIPAALTKAGFKGQLLTALGTTPPIAELIAQAILRAAAPPGSCK